MAGPAPLLGQEGGAIPYIVLARWKARAGKEDELVEILRELAPASRAEPGCRQYSVTRAVGEPCLFVLYEEYADEAAFQVHRESEHFRRLVLGEAARRLESREVTFYETVV